jgi:hypothetical protein
MGLQGLAISMVRRSHRKKRRTKSASNQVWVELTDTIQIYAAWSLSLIIDTAFLALWIAIQWFVNKAVIQPFALSGIDRIVLIAFQILFSFSPLAFIAITIYRDIRT